MYIQSVPAYSIIALSVDRGLQNKNILVSYTKKTFVSEIKDVKVQIFFISEK